MNDPLRDPDHPIPTGNVQPVHLGDGAYASHDSMYVWVSADRGGQFHAVALDVAALSALVEYAKRMGLLR